MAKKGKVNRFEILATKMDKDGTSKEVRAVSGELGKVRGQLKHAVIHIQVDGIDKAPKKIDDLGETCCRRRRRWAMGYFRLL